MALNPGLSGYPPTLLQDRLGSALSGLCDIWVLGFGMRKGQRTWQVDWQFMRLRQ